MKNEKLVSLKDEITHEATIVMAVQNIGVATYEEIMEKLAAYGVKTTIKKIEKACENLQKRQIFSIDLKEQGQRRFLMRRIGVSVPEIGQIKAIVDAKEKQSDEIQALIRELEASKKNAKIAPNNYYDVNVIFETKGKVYGFIPNGNGIANAHYRDSNGCVIFNKKHFRGWLREGLKLVNKYDNAIMKIFTFNGKTNFKDKLPTEEQFKTNIPGTHNSGGRGIAVLEYLPEGTKIETKFRVNGALFTPEQFRKFMQLTGETVSFGGCHKMSDSELVVQTFNVLDRIWIDE